MFLGTALGASVEEDGRTRFEVWAPDHSRVELLLEQQGGGAIHPLSAGPDGCFTGRFWAKPGTRYRYRMDGGFAFSDPCSRFQPEGPHGPSVVVDPSSYRWSDASFAGAPLKGAVIYELHLGAFTSRGDYRGLEERLPYLRDLGVTVLELMPLHTFPGRFNWGYDGTHLFAPCAVYGTPDELRHLVDSAHAHGLAVILDVVYNHLGPDGNYLWQYTRSYFSEKYRGEWGEAMNFEGERGLQVKRFLAQNARHWIAEYHLDGLRLDATQALFDDSPRHVLGELTSAARAAAPHKTLLLVAENEPQDEVTVTPVERGGHGCDALWVDDFHHSARVALTFRSEAYTRDYRGTAPELLSCARHNSLYQGQWYAWQQKHRGSPLLGMAPARAVFFLQDHDQVANFLGGDRIHRFGEPRVRAMTVLWLLLPQTPMLFMGQEFFASTPFHYFVDHHPELQEKVREGRLAFVTQFGSARHAMAEEGYREDIGEGAFLRSKLQWTQAAKHITALRLHRELLRLRREDPVFGGQGSLRMDGAVLDEQALVLRFFGDAQCGDRLLLLNLGRELAWEPCPQPLLAAPRGGRWLPILSSKEIRFGGHGAVFPDGLGPWTLPGQCGLVLRSEGVKE